MTISSLLESKLRAALDGAEGKVGAATDARFGDYQTNAAMVLAKLQRANPRQVAQQIIDRLDVAEMCEPPEIAGAGFINFRLKPAWLAQRFAEFCVDERLGVPAPEKPRKIVIDFSSPNVAKPMHVGHIRSTILGESLARIAEFIGHSTVRDNHIGDWGKQFGMLLVAWKIRVAETGTAPHSIEQLEQMYKEMNARIEGERDERSDPLKKTDEGVITGHLYLRQTPTEQQVSDELAKLQNGDEENLALWRGMNCISRREFDNIYARLAVRFDVTLGESFYNPQLKSIVQELVASSIATESDGALCVFSDGAVKQEDDPFLIKDKDGWRANPALVQKSDGTANYTTTDLATLQYRLATWSPDEIVYVTDGRQQLHFRQFFAIYRRWHSEITTRLAHVWFGSILGDDGRPFKTRSGDTIRLADLLDEAEERALKLVVEKNPDLPDAERREIARIVGIGAVKYADLLPNRQSDYTFSWDKMLSFQGNTAPYLQYSYVRIRSIFRKSGSEFQASDFRFQISEPSEIALAKKLLQFGEVLPQVLEDYRPNVLANYLYELASTFHGFFEACPVLKSEGGTRASRLTLCDATARLLQQGLALLGIEVPERM